MRYIPKFALEFNLDNDAFQDDDEAEIARILRTIADKVQLGLVEGPVKDINGNTIGEWGYVSAYKLSE